MPIQYWPPLQQALQRTRSLLFSPFDPMRWLALGLVAWLIHLGQAGGSAAGSDPDFQTRVRTGDVSGALDSLSDGLVRAIPTDVALFFLLTVGLGILVVMVALLWVGCRMRFVWLENLTAGDHAIGPHWRRYGSLGDSFFFWKLGYYLALLVLALPLAFFFGLFGVLTGSGLVFPATVFGWFLLGVAVFAIGLVASYVDFFAESFVTVIMHRRGLGVLAAWREFRRHFEARPLAFVLVGLMKLLLRVLSAAIVAVFGLATCCVGWLLIALPYVGAVIQLPLYAALRYYDLCWLVQIGGDLGPDRAVTPPPTPVLPAGGGPPEAPGDDGAQDEGGGPGDASDPSASGAEDDGVNRGGSTPGSDPTP